VLRLGNSVAIINNGEVVQVGTPTDIVLRPADYFVADFMRGVSRVRVLAAVSFDAGALIAADAGPAAARDLMDRDGASCAYAVNGEEIIRRRRLPRGRAVPMESANPETRCPVRRPARRQRGCRR